ncbi:DUF4435 domain-containing protein [Desulfitobacterium hafniense]|uniref:DUF4435 domain-containing protein n=1 Tax=Desulfitobacterium hafniense TaxID=49338 RepID=UPI00035F9D7B|nr:DUF4435 domain-containing protein [Desulfitobacterium hafniense]
MNNHLTGSHIANQVLMLKSQLKNYCFILVEGTSDSLGYKWMLNHEKSKLVPAFKKDNVTEAVGLLKAKKIKGVVGIVDSDFWNIEKKHTPPDILNTDTHDIETMILNSPALEKVLLIHGIESKIKKVGDLEKVQMTLLEAAKPLALIRWISYKDNLGLNFKELSFEAFIDANTLEIDIPVLINSVISNTKRCDILPETLFDLYTKYNEKPYDLWQLCNGHDLLEIFSISLTGMFSDYAQPINLKRIYEWLILAYEGTFFSETNLFHLILEWEAKNPFKILNNRYRASTPNTKSIQLYASSSVMTTSAG